MLSASFHAMTIFARESKTLIMTVGLVYTLLFEGFVLNRFQLVTDSGTVDFEEFVNMMSKFRKVKTTNELDDELKEIFQVNS